MPFATRETNNDWGASGSIKQYTYTSDAVRFYGHESGYRYKIDLAGISLTASENRPYSFVALPLIAY